MVKGLNHSHLCVPKERPKQTNEHSFVPSRAGLLAPKLPQVSQVPQLPVTTPTIGPQVIPQLAVSLPAISNCFMLSNMFDPSADNEPGWDTEIRDDVLDECSRFGTVLHIHVDPYSQGNVFVKCALPQVAAAAFNNLNGRFFAGK